MIVQKTIKVMECVKNEMGKRPFKIGLEETVERWGKNYQIPANRNSDVELEVGKAYEVNALAWSMNGKMGYTILSIKRELGGQK